MKKFTDLLQVLLNHFQLKKVQLHQLIMALIQNHTKLYQNKNKTQKNAILEKKDAMKKFTDLLQVLSNHFQLKKVQHLQLTMDLIQSLIKLWLNKINQLKNAILVKKDVMQKFMDSLQILLDLFQQRKVMFQIFQMDLTQKLTKHSLKMLVQQKWTQMYTDSYITMSQEEMNLNTLQLHHFQMDQTQNHSKH